MAKLIKFKNTIFLAYVPIDKILSNNSIGIMWRLKLVMLANHCRESFSTKGDPTEQAKSDMLSTRDILVKYYPEINEFLINEINKITAQEIPNITSPLNPIKVYVKPNED